jgi:hypothetical protein
MSDTQPPPVHVPGGRSVHDLVLADLDKGRRRGRRLAQLIRERRAIGLAEYGTILQVEDPARDPTQDLVEEIGDAITYAKRAALQGVIGAQEMYEALLAIGGSACERWYRSPRERRRWNDSGGSVMGDDVASATHARRAPE